MNIGLELTLCISFFNEPQEVSCDFKAAIKSKRITPKRRTIIPGAFSGLPIA